jgi:hypothetical protein
MQPMNEVDFYTSPLPKCELRILLRQLRLLFRTDDYSESQNDRTDDDRNFSMKQVDFYASLLQEGELKILLRQLRLLFRSDDRTGIQRDVTVLQSHISSFRIS